MIPLDQNECTPMVGQFPDSCGQSEIILSGDTPQHSLFMTGNDWLFEMKRCHHSGYEKNNFEDTADILWEVIKTLMLDPKYGFDDKLSMYAIYEAVRSPVAKEIWEGGKRNPPVSSSEFPALAPIPKITYAIEFP